MPRRRTAFDPRAILAALERNYVDYVLIGGLARVLRGTDEITNGVDICPSFLGENIVRLERAVAELEAASDASPEALAKKESYWEGILRSAEYRHQKFVADAWCATFVWPKQPGELADVAPTNELWRQLRDGFAGILAPLHIRGGFVLKPLASVALIALGYFSARIGNAPNGPSLAGMLPDSFISSVLVRWTGDFFARSYSARSSALFATIACRTTLRRATARSRLTVGA